MWSCSKDKGAPELFSFYWQNTFDNIGYDYYSNLLVKARLYRLILKRINYYYSLMLYANCLFRDQTFSTVLQTVCHLSHLVLRMSR